MEIRAQEAVNAAPKYYPDISEVDRQRLYASGHNVVEFKVYWARQHAVDNGFIAKGGPRGIWRITQAGREYVECSWPKWKPKYMDDKDSKEEEYHEPPEPPHAERYHERDLHPFLAYHAYYGLGAYVKTIAHQKSDKKDYGEWIHPDIVGCRFPLEEWKSEVIELVSCVGGGLLKLFSFELKKSLDPSNLREAFFQAVSNSSWANEGYLVAANIFDEDGFLAELKRLSTSFGIGVIRIDTDDPDNTDVLFSARVKELDWAMVNKLTMNPDFLDFLRRIRADMAIKEIRKEMYDHVLEKDLLISSIKGRTAR